MFCNNNWTILQQRGSGLDSMITQVDRLSAVGSSSIPVCSVSGHESRHTCVGV